MKRLCLLRHAKSDWGDPAKDDFDRPLNPRGATAADGKGLAVIITASGADRAVTVNGSWNWLTGTPGTISSGDSGLLSLEVWGTAETDVYAAWKLIS